MIRKEYEECINQGQLIETGVPDKNMAKELLNLTQVKLSAVVFLHLVMR